MPQNHKKILVIKLSALGDFIQALGPMAAIRRAHPKAHITLLTTKPFEGFAKSSGYFDEVWLDRRPGLLNLGGWLSFRNNLNKGGFERVYDLQNNDRTSFYFKLFSKSSKPEWVGVAKRASHRNTSPKRTEGHAFDGHVQTLAIAGIKDIEVDRLEWIDEDISSFALKPPYVLFVPGCAPQHPYKRWPAEQYGRLACHLAKLGYQPVLLGSEDDKEVTVQIAKICPEALDLTTQTSLAQIVTLAKGADGAVGNDTGPLHLIAPTGCSCLVLFSAHSNPARHAPKGENVTILQENKLSDLKFENVLDSVLLLDNTKKYVSFARKYKSMYSNLMNLEKITEKIREKLQMAPQIGAKVKFDFGDEGVVLIDGTQIPPIITNNNDEADTTLSCSVKTFEEIATGTQDPTTAFMMGQIKAQGSMGYALKLAGILED